MSYRATATDVCDPALAPVSITGFSCFKSTVKGKPVDKVESCVVSFTGDRITITDVGGVATVIEWTARALDASGNVRTTTCHVGVVRQ